MVILGGDIFDNPKPALQELKLFYESISKLKVPVKIISGNHEAIDKGAYTYDFIPQVGFQYLDLETFVVGKTEVVLCGHKNLNKIYGIVQHLKDRKTILFTHVRCNVPPHIKEEFNTQFLADKFNLVISGDIHYPYEPFENFKYCGTPYGIKYSTAVTHGYCVVDTESLDVTYRTLELPNRLKIDCKASEVASLRLNDIDKFKLKILGTIEELQDLGLPKHNVLFEKTISTSEVTEKITISEGKVDILDTLRDITKEMFSLSDKVMEVGEGVISQVMAKYKGI